MLTNLPTPILLIVGDDLPITGQYLNPDNIPIDSTSCTISANLITSLVGGIPVAITSTVGSVAWTTITTSSFSILVNHSYTNTLKPECSLEMGLKINHPFIYRIQVQYTDTNGYLQTIGEIPLRVVSP
jgi:hypothetical protein